MGIVQRSAPATPAWLAAAEAGAARPARAILAITAAVGLVVSFAVVLATGARPFGGIILAMTALACGVGWFAVTTPVRAIMSLVMLGIAFITAHPLSESLGAWPAVGATAGVGALVIYAISRPPR